MQKYFLSYIYGLNLNMKSKLILSIAIFAIVSLASSCRKYEEGPNISLRSKKQRLTNNWGLEVVLINGVDVAKDPYWSKQEHHLYGDEKYIVTIVNPQTLVASNIQGNWKIYDGGKKLALTTNSFAGVVDSTVDYRILKLYEKQLWIRSLDNSRELHFIPFEQ